MTYRLIIPLGSVMAETACFFRVHLSHRENAVSLGIKLIEKAAAIEKKEYGDDSFLKELGSIAENWAIYTLLQGCYIREYHEWERAIKKYLANQRRWNAVPGDFDWKSGRKNFVKRITDALAFFSTSMDQSVISSIDDIRQKVNDIKHSPLDYDVEQTDYDKAVKAFEAFWDKMMELEAAITT